MKFKKLIILLSLICAVFFGFNLSASAYEVGDVVEGVTVTAVKSRSQAYSEYFIYDGYIYIMESFDSVVLDGTTLTFNNAETSVAYSKRLFSEFVADGSMNTGSWANVTSSTIKNISDITLLTASSFDIYDSSGNVVFPPPPVQVAQGLGTITTELLLTVLTELKPIILGLIALVVGFIAFRKAWNWVLTTFSRG